LRVPASIADATSGKGKSKMMINFEQQPQRQIDWMKVLQVASLVLGIMVSLKTLEE